MYLSINSIQFYKLLGIILICWLGFVILTLIFLILIKVIYSKYKVINLSYIKLLDKVKNQNNVCKI